MKRKVEKQKFLQDIQEEWWVGSLDNILLFLNELKEKYAKLGYSNLTVSYTGEYVTGDFEETDEDYKKRLLAKEKKERREYERLKNKFEK